MDIRIILNDLTHIHTGPSFSPASSPSLLPSKSRESESLARTHTERERETHVASLKSTSMHIHTHTNSINRKGKPPQRIYVPPLPSTHTHLLISPSCSPLPSAQYRHTQPRRNRHTQQSRSTKKNDITRNSKFPQWPPCRGTHVGLPWRQDYQCGPRTQL
jgi:hypothetical protein